MAFYPASGQFGGSYSNPQWGQSANSGSSYRTPSGELSVYDRRRAQQTAGSYSGSSPGGNLTSRSTTTTTPTSDNPFIMSVQTMLNAMQQPISTAGMVDPTAAIQAALPNIQRNRDINFAAAGNRFGAMGMGTSTPYASALGEVARASTNDINELGQRLTYDASKDAASRQLEAALAQRSSLGNAAGILGGLASDWWRNNTQTTTDKYDYQPAYNYQGSYSGGGDDSSAAYARMMRNMPSSFYGGGQGRSQEQIHNDNWTMTSPKLLWEPRSGKPAPNISGSFYDKTGRLFSSGWKPYGARR